MTVEEEADEIFKKYSKKKQATVGTGHVIERPADEITKGDSTSIIAPANDWLKTDESKGMAFRKGEKAGFYINSMRDSIAKESDGEFYRAGEKVKKPKDENTSQYTVPK